MNKANNGHTVKESMGRLQKIDCNHLTPTQTGVDGGVDMDVRVHLNDHFVDVEVTLVPDAVNGGWTVYGSDPHQWCSYPNDWSEAELRDIAAAAELYAESETED